jgi:hypothetical protein
MIWIFFDAGNDDTGEGGRQLLGGPIKTVLR